MSLISQLTKDSNMETHEAGQAKDAWRARNAGAPTPGDGQQVDLYFEMPPGPEADPYDPITHGRAKDAWRDRNAGALTPGNGEEMEVIEADSGPNQGFYGLYDVSEGTFAAGRATDDWRARNSDAPSPGDGQHVDLYFDQILQVNVGPGQGMYEATPLQTTHQTQQ